MDEVDILLHPLKSELNFPMGRKDAIDLAGYRWDLPIHLLDAFFLCKMSLDPGFFEVSVISCVGNSIGIQARGAKVRIYRFRPAIHPTQSHLQG
jgi:hypothetical protein